MGVGHLQQVQQPLYLTVFSPVAVQSVKYRIRFFGFQNPDKLFHIAEIMSNHLISAGPEGFGRSLARNQAYLALSRKSAH